MNILTLKFAEFLAAWALADPHERKEFQKKHGPMMEPPRLTKAGELTPTQEVAHDEKGPVFFKDLDPDALRDGQLVRKKT